MKSFLSCKQVNITANQIQKVAFTGAFFAVKSMTGDFTFRMRENDDFVPGAVGLEYHFEPDEEFAEIEITATAAVTIFFYYGVGQFTLSKGIKTYRALVSTPSDPGNPPVLTELENTIGPIVPGYTLAGVYTLTLAGAFPAGKTFVRLTGTDSSQYQIYPVRTDANTITITDVAGDNGHVDFPFEILVYP